MSEQIYQNVKFYVDGYDLSGDSNRLTLTGSADVHDTTVFGCSGRKKRTGLMANEIRIGGFWNSSSGAEVDPVIWNDLGTTGSLVSVVFNGTGISNSTAEDKAYFGENVSGEYSPSGEVGEMFAFDGAYMGHGAMIRGFIMEASSNLTSSGTANIKRIGFRGGAKGLYLAAHVMQASSSGAGITLHLEQDNSTTFAGSPSTAITMALTDANVGSGQLSSTVQGSTADHSYRVNVTQTAGTTASGYRIAVMVGLGK